MTGLAGATLIGMAGYRSLARNRDFTVLWLGDTASELGTQLTLIAFPLVTYAVSGSALSAAWVQALYLIGIVAALLPAGVLVDRLDRRTVMRATAACGTLLFSSLVVASVFFEITVPHLLVVALLGGLASGLYEPAQVSALRAVVSDEELPVALSQNQARSHVAGLVGGPMGGFLFSVTRWLPFAVDALSFLAVWITAARIRTSLAPPDRAPQDVHGWWGDLRAGIGFVTSRAFFRVLLTWAALANLLSNALFFILVLRLIRNGESPVLIGMVSLAIALGGLLGSLVAPRVIDRVPTGALTVIIGWWCVLPLVPLIWLEQAWATMVCMFAMMLLNPIGNAGISSYRMAITPRELQGRVGAASRFLVSALMPLAPLLGGWLLEHHGDQTAVAVPVVGAVLLAVLLTSSRAIRSVPRPDHWQVPAQV